MLKGYDMNKEKYRGRCIFEEVEELAYSRDSERSEESEIV